MRVWPLCVTEFLPLFSTGLDLYMYITGCYHEYSLDVCSCSYVNCLVFDLQQYCNYPLVFIRL